MFAISRFSVTQPVLANMLTVLIVVSGTVTFFLLPRELMPFVSSDFIFITTLYPRASTEEVEKTITVRIEDEISDVRGIKQISSTTVEGRSLVVVEVDTDNTGTDTDQVVRDIESEIEEIEPDLPAEAEKPVVKKLVFEFPCLTVSLWGAVDEQELMRTADFVRDELKTIRGVSDVKLVGDRDEEIWVEIDPARLYGYGLTLEEVRQAIQVGGLDLAAGLARSSNNELIVRTKELYSSGNDVRPVVVRTGRDGGGRVRVEDIAEIRDTFEERTTIGRVNGSRCVNLEVKQRPGTDTLNIARDVRRLLKELKPILPYGIVTSVNRDISFAVRERLSLLTRNGALGLVLCLVVLRLFLSGRMALMTALGIPFAFMGGLLMMRVTGISLNMISMFSLIIVLGMLVDDGIVVAENTHRYLERGVDPVTAAIRGSGEVFWSVVAAVLTTVSAFAPLLLMTGIMGKFCRAIPLVVIFCLGASLVEALVVLPVHLSEWSLPADWDRIRKGEPGGRSGRRPGPVLRMMAPLGVFVQKMGKAFDRSFLSPNRWFGPFLRLYTRFLFKALRHRVVSIAVVVAVAAGVGAYTFHFMKFELFRNRDFAFFAINVEMPPGTRLEETEEAMKVAEDYLESRPRREIEAIITNIGKIENSETFVSTFGSNRAQIIVDLTETQVRPDKPAQQILDEIRDHMPRIPGAAKIEYHVDSGGPPTGPPVNFRIEGENYDRMLEIASSVKAFLKSVPGVKDVKDDFEWGKEELRIRIDRERAAELGLNVAAVAREVRNAFAGGVASSFTRRKKEVEILVKFPEDYRTSLKDIRIMKFKNDRGRLIPFDSFGQVVYGQGLSVINRWNQRRTVTVSADVNTDLITSNEINAMLKKKYGFQSKDYPGITFEYAGENEDTEESMASLKRAFLLAMFVNYAIIATVFSSFLQPLVVMSVIPLAGIGIILGLAIHGEPLGFMAMLGAVALVGIVVNDSIILLDFVNKARRRGVSRWRSLIWASRTRVRPIILTTLTTIGGLTPMLAGVSGTSTFLVPMAIALVYGLLFATTLLLIVVPVLMSFLDDLKSRFGFNLVRAEYDERLLEQCVQIPAHEQV